METAGLLDTSSPSSARAINVRAITKEQVQELVEQHQEQASALLLSVKDKETDLSTEYACKAAIIAAAAPVPAPATLSFSQLYAVVWRGRYLLRSIIPAAARYTQAQRQCMQLAEEKDASANAGSTADADADAAVFAEYTEAVQGTHASLLQSLQAAMNDRARDAAVSLLSSVSQRLDALKKTLPSGAYDVDIKDEEVYDTAVAVIEVSDTVLGTKDSKEAALIGQIDQAVCLLEAIDMLQSSSSPSSPSPPPATAAAAVSSVSSSQSLQTSLALSEESAQALRALGVLAREVVGPLCKLLKNKMEAPTREWKNAFTSISGQQTRELTCGPAGAEIKKNKMSVLFVSWSDVGRSYMSCGGSNITDMQFFAMPPAEMRPYCKVRAYACLSVGVGGCVVVCRCVDVSVCRCA